ncbi:hypothetical protein Tco_1364713, partial [Tanacetum coccineum]
ADDNIIPDLDVALELGRSISLTEAKEEKAARQVHATHARIMTESAKKKTGRKSNRSVVIQDNPKATDTIQALKESKKTNKRQPGTGGSSKGTGIVPGVPDESTVVSATSYEGTGTKPGVPNEEKVITKEKVILEWGSEQESEYSKEDQLDDEEKDDKEGDADDEGDDHISDTQDTDDEDDETESDEDEIYKYKIRVCKDEDVVMTNAEVKDSKKGDAEISDVAQADVEKSEAIKDAAKKAKLPPTSSSLSVSLGAPVTTLPLLSISTTPPVPQQTTTPIPTPPITTETPTITTIIPESDALFAVQLRVAKLEKDVSELKNIDHFAETIATLKS